MYRSLDIKVALAVPIILTTVPPFIMALASSSRSVVGLERPADQAPSLPVGGGKTGSALGSWSGLMSIIQNPDTQGSSTYKEISAEMRDTPRAMLKKQRFSWKNLRVPTKEFSTPENRCATIVPLA
jgi:hypothetical protein